MYNTFGDMCKNIKITGKNGRQATILNLIKISKTRASSVGFRLFEYQVSSKSVQPSMRSSWGRTDGQPEWRTLRNPISPETGDNNSRKSPCVSCKCLLRKDFFMCVINMFVQWSVPTPSLCKGLESSAHIQSCKLKVGFSHAILWQVVQSVH